MLDRTKGKFSFLSGSFWFLLDAIPRTKKSRCSLHLIDTGVLPYPCLLVLPSGGGENARCHRGGRWVASVYVRTRDPARDLQAFSRDSKYQEGHQGPLVSLQLRPGFQEGSRGGRGC